MTIADLKTQTRWFPFKLEQKPGKPKPDKVPYFQGRRLQHRNTMGGYTFADAEAFGYNGVGMLQGEGVLGVDLDECCDAATGKFSAESRELVILLDSYTEYSLNGTGCHTLLIADHPRKKQDGKEALVSPYPGCRQAEVKGTGFFLVFTGRHIGKTPLEILPRQAQIATLCDRLGTTKVKGLTLPIPEDEESRYQKLWNGDMSDYDGNQSRADLALCCILARRYHNNFYEIDRQFRKSALYRDKWEREDYASSTILKAIQINRLVIEEPRLDEDTPAEWIIEPLPGREEGWMPLGEVSLVGGPSGAGKTHTLLKIAENVRHGEDSFGHATTARDYCILLHDRSPASMRRTCKAAKLPMDEVLSRVIRLTPAQQKERPAVIVEAAILSRPDVRLWILEGLDFWTPELHKLDAVGEVMDEMQRVASRNNVALVGTLGSPKQKEHDRYASGRDQFMGSVAFGRKSETCISISRTTDSRVRKMDIYTRNTGDEQFFFTWTDAGLALTSEPADKDTETIEGSALHRMELNVFAAYQPGEEIRYAKDLGPPATFFRWRRVAEASGQVVRTAKKWYRTRIGLDAGLHLDHQHEYGGARGGKKPQRKHTP